MLTKKASQSRFQLALFVGLTANTALFVASLTPRRPSSFATPCCIPRHSLHPLLPPRIASHRDQLLSRVPRRNARPSAVSLAHVRCASSQSPQPRTSVRAQSTAAMAWKRAAEDEGRALIRYAELPLRAGSLDASFPPPRTRACAPFAQSLPHPAALALLLTP